MHGQIARYDDATARKPYGHYGPPALRRRVVAGWLPDQAMRTHRNKGAHLISPVRSETTANRTISGCPEGA